MNIDPRKYIAEANHSVRIKQYENGILNYAKLLVRTPELYNFVAANLKLAQKKYRIIRNALETPTVGVCGYDLGHNAAGRVYTLALIYKTFSHVDIIGCIFHCDKIWEPIRGTSINKKYFTVGNETNFINKSINFVCDNPYDIVHLSKPRMPNIIIGMLYKMIWDSKVILDVDDEELAFVDAVAPISISEYLNTNNQFPTIKNILGRDWTRIAVGLIDYFDGVTVANRSLQKRYGGQIIRHARDLKSYSSNNSRFEARKKFGISQEKLVVMFLGTPRRHKGLIDVAKAIAALDRKDIVFCVVGTFTDIKLKKELENISSNCVFLPNQAFDSLPEILSIADCGILLQDKASLVSQFQTPAKLSDLLAMKLPVLITEVEGIREILDAKLVIGIKDGDEINNAVDSFLKNINRFTELKESIANNYYNMFSLESAAVCIKKIVKGIPCKNTNKDVTKLIDSLFSLQNRESLNEIDKYILDVKEIAQKYDMREIYCRFTNEIMYTLESKNEWDTRSCFSTINSNMNLPLPEVVYIFPAVMAPRNTTRYRVHHLAEQLSTFTKVEIVNYKSIPKDFFEKIAKKNCVIILQRIPFAGKVEENFLNNCKITASTIVYDIDDQIFDEAELEAWRSSCLQASPHLYFKAMQYADQFIVSTKALRNKIECEFNRPVHVIHNQLSKQILSISQNAINHTSINGIFTIGYASGSTTHDKDFSVAIQGLSAFLELHPTVKFHCIGDVVLPDEFIKKFSNQLIVDAKVDFKALPNILATFDVQLVPLESTPFNSYKSHLKFLESSAVSVPIIASNVGEQSLTIIDGYTGILASNTYDCWFNAINWAFNNQRRLRQIGINAHNYVKNFCATESNFNLARTKFILEDMFSGMLRDKISIIIVIYNELSDVVALFNSIFRKINVPYELLIWINSNNESVKKYLSGDIFKYSYVVDVEYNVGKAIAANHLYRIASERFIAGIDDDYIVPDFWDERMLYTAKTIEKLGWLSTNLTRESSGIRDLNKTASFSGGSSIFTPSGVGGWVVFTTASAREKIGFYKEHGLYGGIDGDYNRRARSLGLTTGYVRNVVGEHKIQRNACLAWELFKQRIQDKMRMFGKDSHEVTDKFVDFFNERTRKLTCSIINSYNQDFILQNDVLRYSEALMDSFLTKFDYHCPLHKNNDKNEIADVTIFFSTCHNVEIYVESLNILVIIDSGEVLCYKKLLKYDYIICFSDVLSTKIHNLIPKIKVDTVHINIKENGFDAFAAQIHESVKFLVNNYVEYKSSLLFNLRKEDSNLAKTC